MYTSVLHAKGRLHRALLHSWCCDGPKTLCNESLGMLLSTGQP